MRILLISSLITALTSGSLVYKYQSMKLDAVYRANEIFISNLQREGKEAVKEAKAKELHYRNIKEKAENEYKTIILAIRADNDRLHKDRTNKGYLPSTSSTTSDTDTICFSRDKLQSSIRQLDAGVSRIASRCDEAGALIITIKDWASNIN